MHSHLISNVPTFSNSSGLPLPRIFCTIPASPEWKPTLQGGRRYLFRLFFLTSSNNSTLFALLFQTKCGDFSKCAQLLIRPEQLSLESLHVFHIVPGCSQDSLPCVAPPPRVDEIQGACNGIPGKRFYSQASIATNISKQVLTAFLLYAHLHHLRADPTTFSPGLQRQNCCNLRSMCRLRAPAMPRWNWRSESFRLSSSKLMSARILGCRFEFKGLPRQSFLRLAVALTGSKGNSLFWIPNPGARAVPAVERWCLQTLCRRCPDMQPCLPAQPV